MALTGLEFYSNIFESNMELKDVFDLNRCRTLHPIDFNIDNEGKIFLNNMDEQFINPEGFKIISWTHEQFLELIIQDEQEMALNKIDKEAEKKKKDEKTDYITSLIERLGLYKKTFKKNYKGKDTFYPLYISMDELINWLKRNFNYLLKNKPPHKEIVMTADSKKLIWNGPQAMLFKLFFELTIRKAKGNIAYLNVGKKEIGEFLQNYFLVRGKDGLKPPDKRDANKYTVEGKTKKSNARNAKNSISEIDSIIKASQSESV